MDTMVLHKGEILERVYVNAPELDLHIRQEAGSRVRIHVINIPSMLTSSMTAVKNNIYVEQQGEGCTTELYGIAYLRGEDKVETETHVHHMIGGGESKQLFKFVLDDEAEGAFYGDLLIAKDAQQTHTEQQNRNLLLSREATMRTRPQLEIYADDVRASHGATTGQLDESALFYMQQRGIGRDEAYRMLVAAFLKDVLDTLPQKQQREDLMNTIDRVVE